MQRWASSWHFPYAAILLLQLKRVWGSWQNRDLTTGDTSNYFVRAFGWATAYTANIEWSPLYTTFYGTLLKLVRDVYAATLLHRLAIVFILAALVLAVMRRLLPSSIAWLVAAWWATLPINFDSLYEVHLFAVLLPLAAVLLVLYRDGPWTRGAALGILVAQMLLVRNETFIAVCIWALVCTMWEIRHANLRSGRRWEANAAAYGLPILLAVLAAAFFYWRTVPKLSRQAVIEKHTVNICQVYAFGYQQRHTDWTGSPWTDCRELMLRIFGKPLPSILETIQLNPRAALGMFLWNIRLFPAGLQVALFNATTDNVNPDYAPVRLRNSFVMIPSLLAIGLLGFGFRQIQRERHYWWSAWIRDRVWGWILLACMSTVVFLVIPMERPRPSYMFSLTLLLMAALGMCVFVLTHGSPIERRYPRISLLVGAVLVLLVPPYYATAKQPLLTLYRQLYSARDYLGIPDTAIVTPGYGQELCNYFTHSATKSCVGNTYAVLKELPEGASLGSFLDGRRVPVVALYVDIGQGFLIDYGNNAAVQSFLANPESEGWKLISMQDTSGGSWRVYANVRRLGLSSP